MKSASASAHGLQNNFSPQAIADLESAVRFIAKDNPGAALRVGNALIDQVSILENFPSIGSLHPKRPSIRKLVSGPYIIYYRPRLDQNCVDILRLARRANGARVVILKGLERYLPMAARQP